jgi:hypothetical protein
MPEYKVVNISQLENDLTIFANSIRAKANISAPLTFPHGFAQGISDIEVSENYAFLLDEKITLASNILTSQTVVLSQSSVPTDLPSEYEIGMIGNGRKVITRYFGNSYISVYYTSYNGKWSSSTSTPKLFVDENGSVNISTGNAFSISAEEMYLYLIAKKEG